MKPRHLLLLLLIPLLCVLGCGSNDIDEALQLRFTELVRKECVVSQEISDYKATIEKLDLDVRTFKQYETLLNSSMTEMAQIHEEKQQILEYFSKSKEVEAEKRKSGFSFEARFSSVYIMLGL